MPQLPPEVFARLDCLYSFKEIEDQIDVFSELLPVSRKKALRWNKPMLCLPYHHCIDSESQSKLITLDILSKDLTSVLTLQCNCGAWHKVKTITLKLFASEQKTYYTNAAWVPMSATAGQKSHIAKLLSIPTEELPLLSAYNAALVIDAALMMKHWRRVNLLCRIWHSEQQLQRTA